FSIAHHTPIDQDARACSGAIDQNVPGRAGSRSDVGLMKFIERGVSGSDKEANDEGTSDSRLTLAKRPEKKGGEYRVFGEVGAFADNELDGSNGCIRNIGSEPAEERTDESRSVLGGKQVGGADENKNHPGQDRQPIFQKQMHRKQNHNRAACANFAA
ncbi:MAG: hypothetical protein QOF24_3083, partial [Verrucomicrobiota bacterium]